MEHLAPALITYRGGSDYTIKDLRTNWLLSGQTLYRGDYLWSRNGKYQLVMRDDGNLVLCFHPDIDNHEEVWSTQTAGIAIHYCKLETNGNLALYKHNREIAFQTNTDNRPGADLVLQDNGVISLVQPQIVWSTNNASKTQ